HGGVCPDLAGRERSLPAFFIPFRPTAVRCAPMVQRAAFFMKQTVVSRRGLLDHRRLCVALCIEEQ
ncbi:hypothetical protein, partial [Serratia sp. ME43]|uniref:hypothetical protein n=1 Tax=Serratia sp. ME43 TaxID=2744256 RepID=UPI001C7173A9